MISLLCYVMAFIDLFNHVISNVVVFYIIIGIGIIFARTSQLKKEVWWRADMSMVLGILSLCFVPFAFPILFIIGAIIHKLF